MALDFNKDLEKLMQEAHNMQAKMQDAQKQLSELVIKVSSGKVTLEMDGKHNIRSLMIAPEALKENIANLTQNLISAMNDAVAKIETASRDKIVQLTAGLNLPTEFGGAGEEKE